MFLMIDFHNRVLAVRILYNRTHIQTDYEKSVVDSVVLMLLMLTDCIQRAYQRATQEMNVLLFLCV